MSYYLLFLRKLIILRNAIIMRYVFPLVQKYISVNKQLNLFYTSSECLFVKNFKIFLKIPNARNLCTHNLIKIRSFTSFLLMICCGVRGNDTLITLLRPIGLIVGFIIDQQYIHSLAITIFINWYLGSLACDLSSVFLRYIVYIDSYLVYIKTFLQN